jgi:phosphopantetheinyl transferase (holo-ACP synthase)
LDTITNKGAEGCDEGGKAAVEEMPREEGIAPAALGKESAQQFKKMGPNTVVRLEIPPPQVGGSTGTCSCDCAHGAARIELSDAPRPRPQIVLDCVVKEYEKNGARQLATMVRAFERSSTGETKLVYEKEVFHIAYSRDSRPTVRACWSLLEAAAEMARDHHGKTLVFSRMETTSRHDGNNTVQYEIGLGMRMADSQEYTVRRPFKNAYGFFQANIEQTCDNVAAALTELSSKGYDFVSRS